VKECRIIYQPEPSCPPLFPLQSHPISESLIPDPLDEIAYHAPLERRPSQSPSPSPPRPHSCTPAAHSHTQVQIRLSIQRLRTLQEKRLALAKKSRREIADLLTKGRVETCRLRVEGLIQDDIYMELLELLEVCFNPTCIFMVADGERVVVFGEIAGAI